MAIVGSWLGAMWRRALGVSTLAAAAMLGPCTADAQYYAPAAPYYDAGRDREERYERIQYRDGYDRGTDVQDYRDDRRPRGRRADYRDRRPERCDRGATGTLLGAVAGGLLGNAAVGRRGSRAAGTLAGAGVGALVGNAADRGC